MDMLVAAELHIARETSTTYHVRYLRRSEPGGAITPWCVHGRTTLRVLLQQFESAWKIDTIVTRVDAGIRYVLDLGYVDEERVARVFRHYAHGPLPAGASDALASPRSRRKRPPGRGSGGGGAVQEQAYVRKDVPRPSPQERFPHQPDAPQT